MAEVPSTFQLQPGEIAPAFTLPDSEGREHSLESLLSGQKGLLIAFVCNHCPFVIHLAKELGEMAATLQEKGIATVAISANDASRYPADSPEKMVEFAAANDWDFPYLYDKTQEVAKAYAAACTPDFYLFDGKSELVYAGQFDESRPGRGSATGSDLAAAAENLLNGSPTPLPWYPSSGCSIKWVPGSEPDYFG
jgi:peroxiredoxin